MLADLIRRLSSQADPKPLAADDARIAVAALLVIAAHADHDYADSERAMIERVLRDRYGLDAPTATRLREQGEAAEAASTDLYRFTSLIKQSIAHEERVSVLEALWRVILADAQREMHEEAMMRRVVDLLGLDAHDSVAARRRAEAG
jgi:uncharacterized tellurite resistance protein B-like protein